MFEMLTVVFPIVYNRFKEGREVVNGDAHPVLPSTSTTDENVEAVKKKILDNRWITIGEVAADSIGKSFSSFQAIFTDVLSMKCAAENIVSYKHT